MKTPYWSFPSTSIYRFIKNDLVFVGTIGTISSVENFGILGEIMDIYFYKRDWSGSYYMEVCFVESENSVRMLPSGVFEATLYSRGLADEFKKISKRYMFLKHNARKIALLRRISSV